MFLCNFTEYGANNGVSMKDCFEKEPYFGKDEIVSYLKNSGKATLATAARAKDRITDELIKGEQSIVHYSDGVFTWVSDLAYHVEKYNLRLPKEFEEYVLNKMQ